MESTYNHKAVEAAAQSHWSQTNAYAVVENDPRFPKGKYYACSMLPYPSGKLHMGHVRNYTINDMMYRQLRMRGYNVLQPMGWDAFGLPAENAAMKNKVPPAKWTYENINYMKEQMQSMGLAIDWSREMAACSPDYYRWNQWLFLKMLEKGIAYRKTQIVNWDPVDMTVLANEQVIDGRGWRTGAPVEKREIPGYYLKITDYAQELLDPVANPESPEYLKGWPDRVRAMQENWIGKSEGVRFAFPHAITDKNGKPIQDGKMYVFTTRADTIMGVTFVAVAPEHPLAMRAGERDQALALRIEALKAGGTTELELATKEKEGVATGLFVSHPLTGDNVELWVGNYVLMSYGDGAVMGVPAHDERDFAFAKKYGLEIKQVVASVSSGGKGVAGEEVFSTDTWHDWYGDKQIAACVNSGKYDGLGYKAAVSCRRSRHQKPRRKENYLASARLGYFAPALLGHADPDRALRRARCAAGAVRPAAGDSSGRLHPRRLRQSVAQARRFPPRCDLSGVRQNRATRDRYDGYFRRFVVVLHALHLARQQTGDGR